MAVNPVVLALSRSGETTAHNHNVRHATSPQTLLCLNGILGKGSHPALVTKVFLVQRLGRVHPIVGRTPIHIQYSASKCNLRYVQAYLALLLTSALPCLFALLGCLSVLIRYVER